MCSSMAVQQRQMPTGGPKGKTCFSHAFFPSDVDNSGAKFQASSSAVHFCSGLHGHNFQGGQHFTFAFLGSSFSQPLAPHGIFLGPLFAAKIAGALSPFLPFGPEEGAERRKGKVAELWSSFLGAPFAGGRTHSLSPAADSKSSTLSPLPLLRS